MKKYLTFFLNSSIIYISKKRKKEESMCKNMLEQFAPAKGGIRVARLEELFNLAVARVTVNHNLSPFWERREVVIEMIGGDVFRFSMREAKAVSCFLHSLELSRSQSFFLLMAGKQERIYLSSGKEGGFFLDGVIFLSKEPTKGYCNIPVISPFENYSFAVCRVLPPKKTIETLRSSCKSEEELSAKIRELVMAKYSA